MRRFAIIALLLLLAIAGPAAAQFGLPPFGGGTPVSALLYSQNWDGVTAPAVPSDFTVSGAVVTSTTIAAATGTNTLRFPILNSALTYALSNAPDTNNGNVLVSSKASFVNTTGNQDLGVAARANSGLTTYYYMELAYSVSDSPRGMVLGKKVSGTNTVLASVSSTTAFVANTYYRVFLETLGTTISSKIRRETDGYWLNSSAAWQQAETAWTSQTDSSISGAGYYGPISFLGTGTSVAYQDDFEVYKDASTMLPATALRVGPTNATTLSGVANHRAYAISVFTDGSLSFPLSLTLSDGGIGGQFFDNSSATPYIPITSSSIPANTKLGNKTIFYSPPYNQSTPPTITISSALGSKTVSPGINAYTTTGAPTWANLSFDQVAYFAPSNQWSALPRDIPAAGFANGLTGFTNLTKTGSPTETETNGIYQAISGSGTATVMYRSASTLLDSYYNIEVQLTAWGGGSTDNITVGAAIDGSNYIGAIVDNAASTVTLYSVTAGAKTSINSLSSISFPAGTKFLFQVGVNYPEPGTARGSLWYLRPGSTNYYLATWGNTGAYDWAKISVLTTFYPVWGTQGSIGTGPQVTNFTAGLAGAYEIVNVGTVLDASTGGPILTPDQKSIYVFGSISGPGGGGGVGIYTLNTQTWQFTEVARLVLDDGTYRGINVGSLSYYAPTTTWYVMSSNWNVAYTTAAIAPGYATTTADLLSGVHYLAVSALPLPNTVAAGAGSPLTTYDQEILFDGTTITICYIQADAAGSSNGGANWGNTHLGQATAASLNGPWTQNWLTSNATVYDGSRFTQVGGHQYCSATGAAGLPAYDRAAGTSIGNAVNVTLDNGSATFTTSSGDAPHPGLAPIPGEINGQTRYVLPLFWDHPGGFDVTGLPKQITPAGTVWVFEALQRYTSPEFTWITLNYLLERDLDPAANDNRPVGLGMVG